METLVLIVHVVLAVAVVALVLMQQGKGAEAGAAFGGGASQTVFGSQGSSSFLVKVTALLALGLFVTSFALAVYAKNQAAGGAEAGIPAAAVIEQAQQQGAADKADKTKAADEENTVPQADEAAGQAPADEPVSDIPTVDGSK